MRMHSTDPAKRHVLMLMFERRFRADALSLERDEWRFVEGLRNFTTFDVNKKGDKMGSTCNEGSN